MTANNASLGPIPSPEPISFPKGRVWAGRVLSALPVLVLAAGASGKLAHAASVAQAFVTKFGYSGSVLTPIGVVELLCAVLYVIPRTAVLGAVLLTGYLGGAVATHVRIGEPFLVPLLTGILLWVGLFLRDHRIRALLPLRKSA